MQAMRALIYPIKNRRRLFVEMGRCCFRGEAAIRSYLHAFARRIAVEEALKGIDNTFDWRKNALFL